MTFFRFCGAFRRWSGACLQFGYERPDEADLIPEGTIRPAIAAGFHRRLRDGIHQHADRPVLPPHADEYGDHQLADGKKKRKPGRPGDADRRPCILLTGGTANLCVGYGGMRARWLPPPPCRDGGTGPAGSDPRRASRKYPRFHSRSNRPFDKSLDSFVNTIRDASGTMTQKCMKCKDNN